MLDIRKDLQEIKETLIRNTVSLEEHIKRTTLAEARIEKLEKYQIGFLASLLIGLMIRLLIK
jgi:hypothetical protein